MGMTRHSQLAPIIIVITVDIVLETKEAKDKKKKKL